MITTSTLYPRRSASPTAYLDKTNAAQRLKSAKLEGHIPWEKFDHEGYVLSPWGGRRALGVGGGVSPKMIGETTEKRRVSSENHPQQVFHKGPLERKHGQHLVPFHAARELRHELTTLGDSARKQKDAGVQGRGKYLAQRGPLPRQKQLEVSEVFSRPTRARKKSTGIRPVGQAARTTRTDR